MRERITVANRTQRKPTIIPHIPNLRQDFLQQFLVVAHFRGKQMQSINSLTEIRNQGQLIQKRNQINVPSGNLNILPDLD